MRAESGLLKGLNPTVTIWSLLAVVLFVLFCALFAEHAAAAFQRASDFILQNFKWFYLISVTGVLGLLFYLMCSQFGHIKLGRDDDKPEFSFGSWIAMLFSGGMGIGLIFWSVAEPMWHYAGNPFATGLTDEAATTAMRITLFHWGLHPWAIFTIVGLGLAYFAYRKGLPLSMRSILYPLIGERIYGPIGHVVDILAVVITAFGVSQSLGLGVVQMNTGLSQVFDLPISLGVQVTLIVLITLVTTVSVMAGVSRGMKRLSEWNMLLSVILVVLILLLGPTRYILNLMLESTGDYAQHIVGLSFWSDAQKDSGWQNWWTAFYWPWWMTWGPFVGLFIARISKGRTIRELIAGALLVPTLVTIVWMSVFGGAALKTEQVDRQHHELRVASGELQGDKAKFEGGTVLLATKQETTAAMFTLLHKIDAGTLGKVLSVLVCILLATYFITSADSGTQVLCTLNSMGSANPPQSIRLLWCILEGAIATALLMAGGLKAIQMASIAAGLPIAGFILLISYTLMRSLRQEMADGVLDTPPGGRMPIPQIIPQGITPVTGTLTGGGLDGGLTAKKAS
ncbi:MULTISPECIES: BCCT family transporter [Pseudomonas]|uniref:BCCT family transporter n=1 Tax=Pseudomonas TaxID=286 RepID=UPI000FB73D95|nr:MULTISPECIES: BCCT family transporter [Pseudomonas]MBG6125574.1 choline/carnitine/betaine transport [Pseudomonas sp. M2]NSX22511.1 BCCT family transporter [Pseudomonas putida]HDS1747588.1 BCCT family transporter [Pseudomonas putida]